MRGRYGRALALASLSLIACSSGTTPSSETSSSDGGNAGDGFAGTMGSGGNGGGSSGGSGSTDASQTVTQMVGAAGGAVTAPGVVLTVPAGALSNDTQITVTASGMPVPTGYVGLSPVFTFGPAGTTFAVPVTVKITYSGSAANASIFWSNASGGYDALPTTSTATALQASVTRLGDGFAGEDKRDATAPTDTGSSADTGESMDSSVTSETGASSDTGTTADASASSDAGVAADARAPADAGTATDTGTASETGSDAGPTTEAAAPDDAATGSDSSGVADAGTSEAGASDSGATTDAAAGDAGTPGIFVTISGVATSFIYNVTAVQFQAWWEISADDSATGAHWTMSFMVPTNMGGPITCGGSFPEITYVHYTATGDAGTADTTYTTNTTGGSCSITATTTAQTAGADAMGTFTGSLWLQTDSGNRPSKSLTAGTYDIIVP